MSRTLRWAALVALALTTSPALAGETADLGRVPAGAALVLHVDVEGLLRTRLVSSLVAKALENPKVAADLDKLKRSLGVDIQRDIQGLTVALPTVGEEPQQILFQLQAKVDRKKLLTVAKKGGKLTEERYAGQTLYKGPDGNTMAMMGDRILVGTHALVRRAVDAQKGKRPLTDDKEMMALIKRADTGKHAWMALRVDAAARKRLGAQNPDMGKLESVVMSLGLAGGLQFDARLVANDAKAARTAIGALNAQSKAQLQNPVMAAMGLAPVFRNLKAAAQGKTAVISLRLTEPEVAQLMKTATGMLGLGGRPRGGRPMPPPGTHMKATPPASKGSGK